MIIMHTMADQLLLTHLHQQASDYLQQQPIPNIFSYLGLTSLHVLQTNF